jgi:NAD(P)-dependent dehydrogenase (short-subunit alcohol dehydrogenase family)
MTKIKTEALVVLVTGANKELGKEAVRELAGQPAEHHDAWSSGASKHTTFN